MKKFMATMLLSASVFSSTALADQVHFGLEDKDATNQASKANLDEIFPDYGNAEVFFRCGQVESLGRGCDTSGGKK